MLTINAAALWLIIMSSISLIGFIVIITTLVIQQRTSKSMHGALIGQLDLSNTNHDQHYQHLLQTPATLNGPCKHKQPL